DTALGPDLGLDSLSRIALALALESDFGHAVANLEELVRVGDCLAAAAGLLGGTEGEAAPPAWFAPAPEAVLTLSPEAGVIPDIFLAKVREAPDAPLLADRRTLLGRREVLTRAFILAGRFAALPGKRLGVMLPAAPVVPVVWLAAMLAGKEAVFFNWTIGEANLRHCLELTGVTRVVTSSALTDRLERGGLALSRLPVTWLCLEELAASLRPWEKLRGAVRARFPGARAACSPADPAAVLFTSGSESRPKAVPLTHRNLLANAGDIIAALRLGGDDSLLSMLPPFHSFGLMVGLVLPLSLGLRAAFHPNPTEAGPLLSLARDYRTRLLAAPPTFLELLLNRARGTDQLAGLRFAFVGAEKCPDRVYRAFAELCPDAALCEGYGITECSPVISLNRPESPVPGTIGHALPSVELALVRETDGAISGRAATGETGMLLVRGPSVFPGYLGDAPDPFVRFEDQTWYRTGDLVSQDENGRLTFRGRLKRFVKIGGEMISLPQMENALLEAFSSGSDAGGGPVLAVEAASEEEDGAEITLFTCLPLTVEEANAALRAAGLSALYAVRRVVRLEAIPLLGSGKTDYRALKKP
ncbi:MAG: AMP-binding protein, partial [Deltaproteobacteria bacterium]|nr:AMP-binding protein [Deltaproteobacteria bacterium]